MKSTGTDYFFPDDFTMDNISNFKDDKNINDIINNILGGIRDIATGISNIIKGLSNDNPKSLLFENQDNGYYIYGLDILIRNNLEPVLIECNKETGYGCFTEAKMNELSQNIFKWINETILEPLFKYNHIHHSHRSKHQHLVSHHKLQLLQVDNLHIQVFHEQLQQY